MRFEPMVLASTSPYRSELLARLGLPFEAVPPVYEEAELPGLSPAETALAHAVGKAREVSARFPDRLVIGSDQVAEVDGRPLGKPGSEAAAVEQLSLLAGRTTLFHTGVAVRLADREEFAVECFRVTLRSLAREDLVSYVAREKPLGCAGSFRVEGLGIALMERLEGRDYTALIGLPLIVLTELLGRFGVNVLRPRG